MNFASAYISMIRGHRIRRKHWSGYWEMKDNEVMFHCKDGKAINLRDTDDMSYTLSNIACDDWEIADDYGTEYERD